MKNKIKLIVTGGTITMYQNEHGEVVPATSPEQFLQAMPTLDDIDLDVVAVSNLPSAHVTESVWLLLAHEITVSLAQGYNGVVVVHGSDTLEETAFFLDAALSINVLQNMGVVVTGAMRSFNQLSADGPANLFGALCLSIDARTRGAGVLVYFNDVAISAREATKSHTMAVQTFVSKSGSLVARRFDCCGEISFEFDANGLMGLKSDYWRRMCMGGEGGVYFEGLTPTASDEGGMKVETLPKVTVLKAYVGADPEMLGDAFRRGARGFVIEAVGASSLPLDYFQYLRSFKLDNPDCAVVIASRCFSGLSRPVYGYLGGGHTLAEINCFFADDLSAIKAKILLQIILSYSAQNQAPLLNRLFYVTK